MNIFLPIVIFVGWTLFAALPAQKLAIEDTLNDVPLEKRRGTSILPMIPILPLVVWGITIFLGYYISQNIFLYVALAHEILILFCIFVLSRDRARLRKIEKAKAAEQGAAANP